MIASIIVLLALKLGVSVEVGKGPFRHRSLKSHSPAALPQDLEEIPHTPEAQWVMCWEEVEQCIALLVSTGPSLVLHIQPGTAGTVRFHTVRYGYLHDESNETPHHITLQMVKDLWRYF